MGEVYRAHDEVLARTVALKVLRSNLGADPDFVERFRREATNAARLSHPSIVQVYDWGRDESDAFMAMEFIDGQNLREILSTNPTLPPGIVARIAFQVCAALEHARRAGIVHRDIKPENVLITADGAVKVADFGLARALAESRATQAGVVFGTAAYLAPEQVLGNPVDHRADLYALGCMIYEMLTGSPPFTGDNPAAIAYRRVNEDVPVPGDSAPTTPPALDSIVARSTARMPDDRFATAADMAASLRGAFPDVSGSVVDIDVHQTTAIPVATQDTVVIDRLRKTAPEQTKRRRLLVVLAVLVLLAISIPLAVRSAAKVTVPNVSGMTESAAVAQLTKLGFHVNTDHDNSDTIPADQVIGTEPPVNSKLRKGADVRVLISDGPRFITVPDLVNKQLADAARLLAENGLKGERINVNDAAPIGTVIAQQPQSPSAVRRGSTVKLTVSMGPQRVAVPDVKNKTQDEASKMLTDAGFNVAIQQKEDDKVPEGSVISTTPAAGTKAPKGSTVTMVVSKGAPLVTVPDLTCMTRAQASDAAAHAGFKITFEGRNRDNIVVDQDPVPNSKAHKGSTITAIVGFGSRC